MLATAPRRRLLRPPVAGDGQGLVEYGLILAGIAIVAIVALVFFEDTLSAVLEVVGTAIDQATS